MKTKILLAMMAGLLITQTGCTTKVRSLPMPAAVQTQNTKDVPLYFGNQQHANVKTKLGVKEVSVRVARTMDGQEATCEIALNKALDQLRDYARDRHADAVINVTTRFQHNESASSTEFTCGASNNGSTLAVRGDVVKFDVE
ncbi:hypothetical protein [Caballeronia sp. Lep1P3]|uniref:hypothetical protein n=1 Tax=Caballeronia sp. Lep1P3 TaxID=2878150 RepID=UPI001FD240A1|nr:hypothetical protein [Caballeronia sp. Lep1P3]